MIYFHTWWLNHHAGNDAVITGQTFLFFQVSNFGTRLWFGFLQWKNSLSKKTTNKQTKNKKKNRGFVEETENQTNMLACWQNNLFLRFVFFFSFMYSSRTNLAHTHTHTERKRKKMFGMAQTHNPPPRPLLITNLQMKQADETINAAESQPLSIGKKVWHVFVKSSVRFFLQLRKACLI